MKVGVLICDHVQPSLQNKFGDYAGMFKQLFSEVDQNIELINFYAVDGQLPEHIDSCDVYISTGSKASVNDNIAWINALEAFIKQLYQANKIFIGICFGHQLIAKALGGKVEQSNKGWGIGIATAVVEQSKPWMQPKQKQIKLIVSHQEQISQLPPTCEVLMTSDFCPYSMIKVGQSFIGLQGHPEFSYGYSQALMNARKHIIPALRIKQGQESLIEHADNRLMMRWLLHFIGANLENNRQ